MDTDTKKEITSEVAQGAMTIERRAMMVAAALVIIVGGAAATAAYLAVSASRIYIEKSDIEAPTVVLTAPAPGVLRALYVSEGQVIPPNTVVAQVGTDLIKSTAGGLVIAAEEKIGQNVAEGQAIVTTIDPAQLSAVGRLDEDKGLASLKVGDRALFTVDAFGGKKYSGVVEEIAPTSRNSDVVFSISDKRETKVFDVKVAFDTNAYPELKNGMSARIWVYTK
jgi:multidrug resistance efflux pump